MLVLVADDSAVSRGILKKQFRNLGIETVDEAVDGIEAMNKINFSKANNYLYDLAVLDVNMPKANGLRVLQHIREVAPDIKVIMCSAANDQFTVKAAVGYGAKGYLVKPFAPEKLIELVEAFFGKQNSS